MKMKSFRTRISITFSRVFLIFHEVLFCFASAMTKRHPLLHSVFVHFRGEGSNEGRGVFLWFDIKYQQCFSEMLTVPINEAGTTTLLFVAKKHISLNIEKTNTQRVEDV